MEVAPNPSSLPPSLPPSLPAVLTVTLVKTSVGDIVEGAGMAEACLEFSGPFAAEFPLIITATITNDTG